MKLHFRALGDGPPLVILHGLLGSLDNWVPIAQQLAVHFKVLLPDLRNHGRSPHAEDSHYEAMADDIRRLLNDLDIRAAHLLGHSMGAKVAMRFAQLHAQAVQRLVVVDMAPREYAPRFDVLLDAMHAIDLSRFQRRDEVDAILTGAIPDKSVRQFLLKNLGRDGAGRLFWKPNLASLRANYGNLRAALPTDDRFRGPTLFMRGESSDYVRDEDLPAIRTLFPGALLETIPGAGHWVHADAPGRFTEVVTRFLLAKS